MRLQLNIGEPFGVFEEQVLDEHVRHSVARWFGFRERIDEPHARVSETVLVPADHGEVVNECRRRQESVERWHRRPQAEGDGGGFTDDWRRG